MKTTQRRSSNLLVALAACLVAMLPTFASADSPPLIPIQGILTDAEGAPITGTRNVTFSLYDLDIAGEAFFTETQSLSIEVLSGLGAAQRLAIRSSTAAMPRRLILRCSLNTQRSFSA